MCASNTGLGLFTIGQTNKKQPFTTGGTSVFLCDILCSESYTHAEREHIARMAQGHWVAVTGGELVYAD